MFDVKSSQGILLFSTHNHLKMNSMRFMNKGMCCLEIPGGASALLMIEDSLKFDLLTLRTISANLYFRSGSHIPDIGVSETPNNFFLLPYYIGIISI